MSGVSMKEAQQFEKMLELQTRAEKAEADNARLESRVAELDENVTEWKGNYGKAVDKFDDCRAALARRVEKDTGQHAPPDDYVGEWHEWLILQSDQALGGVEHGMAVW